ncbi:MAG TPA: hypothetical protein VHO84_03915, partial [Syntrophorhabdaceae bacterium]|nr:hypothetical protein [Syntrophorhabdaceae bacterium]
MEQNVLRSTALEINLERTKAVVEIPARYRPFLDVAAGHYGVLKRTEDLLIELNHPYVNWEYVLNQVKSLAIGDFYDFNMHSDGLSALATILDIYLEVIRTASDETQDSAVRYIYEYLNVIAGKSGTQLERNAVLISKAIRSILEIARSDKSLLKKSSTYIKSFLKLVSDHNIVVDIDSLNELLYIVFESTYRFWLNEPDPAEWFSGGE